MVQKWFPIDDSECATWERLHPCWRDGERGRARMQALPGGWTRNTVTTRANIEDYEIRPVTSVVTKPNSRNILALRPNFGPCDKVRRTK